MLLQLEHPLVQTLEIVHEVADLGMDLVGGLAHAGVLLDLLYHLDRQHQQRGRDQHHARAIGPLHQVVKTVVQFGEHRFRGHEHQRNVLRLARHQIFLGDVGDMATDIRPQPCRRLLARVLALGLAQRGDGFEREFGIDHERPAVVQEHRAVGALAVAQGMLERECALRQRVLDDRFHAALAEGTARLLVREHGAE